MGELHLQADDDPWTATDYIFRAEDFKVTLETLGLPSIESVQSLVHKIGGNGPSSGSRSSDGLKPGATTGRIAKRRIKKSTHGNESKHIEEGSCGSGRNDENVLAINKLLHGKQ